MRILTCCKVVPDLDMIIGEDWDIRDLNIDTRFARREWNCFDESALEMALRFADALREGVGITDTHLTALTIGGKETEPFLKMLLALKFNRTVRIDSTEDFRFRPSAVAELIAFFVRGNEFDVILAGRQSGVGDNGQTPLLLAEMLNLPCVTQVCDIQPDFEGPDESTLSGIPGKTLRIKSEADDGILEQVIKTPCVLTIGNAQNTYLRVPTLKDRMRQGKRPVELIPPPEPPAESASAPVLPSAPISPSTGDGFRLTELVHIDNRRTGIIIDRGTPEEKARTLYEEHLKKLLETVWNTG